VTRGYRAKEARAAVCRRAEVAVRELGSVRAVDSHHGRGSGRGRDRSPNKDKTLAQKQSRGHLRNSDYNNSQYYTHCRRPGHTYNTCQSKNWAKVNVITTIDTVGKHKNAFFMVTSATHVVEPANETKVWYLNSSASQSFTCNRHYLHNFIPTPESPIHLGDNSLVHSTGCGTVITNVVFNSWHTTI
jgi:hypothetical protein